MENKNVFHVPQAERTPRKHLKVSGLRFAIKKLKFLLSVSTCSVLVCATNIRLNHSARKDHFMLVILNRERKIGSAIQILPQLKSEHKRVLSLLRVPGACFEFHKREIIIRLLELFHFKIFLKELIPAGLV